jgi:hypothetical protein
MKAYPLILLVGDSSFFRLIERHFLGKSQVEIIETSSAEETLALCPLGQKGTDLFILSSA